MSQNVGRSSIVFKMFARQIRSHSNNLNLAKTLLKGFFWDINCCPSFHRVYVLRVAVIYEKTKIKQAVVQKRPAARLCGIVICHVLYCILYIELIYIYRKFAVYDAKLINYIVLIMFLQQLLQTYGILVL